MSFSFRPTPAPQVIDGVTWEVRDSGEPNLAFVDFTNNIMVVPMDDSPLGNMIRAHETIHVDITPREAEKFCPPGVENRTMQAVEDCRVYSFANVNGIDTNAGHWNEDDVRKTAKEPIREQARALMAVRHTQDEPKMREYFDQEAIDLADRLIKKYFEPAEAKGTYPSFEDTIACATELEQEAQQQQPEPQQGEGQGQGSGNPQPGSGGGQGNEQTTQKKKKETPSTPLEKPSEKGEQKETDGRDFLSNQDHGEIQQTLGNYLGSYYQPHTINTRSRVGPIGENNLNMNTPPLKKRLKPGKSFGLKKVSADSGIIPRHMERYAMDKAIYKQNIRKGFGTMLIDGSGSLALRPTQIEEIIAAVPDAHVAMYCGRKVCSPEKPGYGQMYILAKEGKRVEEIPMHPKENICDYEALHWLSRQRGPRWWISDGLITTRVNDYEVGFLEVKYVLDLVRLCKRYDIKRFNSLDEFLNKDKASSVTHENYNF